MNSNDVINMMKDQITLEMISMFSPNEKDSAMMVAMLQVFIKHGVHADKALEILKDLNEVMNKDGSSK